LEEKTVVHPVCQAECCRVHERADNNQFTSNARLGALGLVDGTGGRRQSHPETIDDSADDHLGQMPSDDLKDRTDKVADESQGNGLSAPEFVTGSESEDGAKESPKLYSILDFGRK
jgi:hypothetical protein